MNIANYSTFNAKEINDALLCLLHRLDLSSIHMYDHRWNNSVAIVQAIKGDFVLGVGISKNTTPEYFLDYLNRRIPLGFKQIEKGL